MRTLGAAFPNGSERYPCAVLAEKNGLYHTRAYLAAWSDTLFNWTPVFGLRQAELTTARCKLKEDGQPCSSMLLA
jgi:hypothetical protein